MRFNTKTTFWSIAVMSLLTAPEIRKKGNCDTSMKEGEVRIENIDGILTLLCAEISVKLVH